MNPEQWLSLKWNGGSTMSDRWLNQSKIIHNIKNIIPNGKTDLKKKKLKRLKESANYTILGDQKNILIKLR